MRDREHRIQLTFLYDYSVYLGHGFFVNYYKMQQDMLEL